MSIDQILIRASGMSALFCGVMGLSAKDDNRLMVLVTFGAIFWSINNFLLGAHTTCALSLVSAARTFTSMKIKQHRSPHAKPACLVFIVVSLAACALTWQGPVSLLPVVGSIASTLGNFLFKGVKMRLSFVISNLMGLSNGLYFHAIEQVASQFISIGAIFVGIYRQKKSQVSLVVNINCERKLPN